MHRIVDGRRVHSLPLLPALAVALFILDLVFAVQGLASDGAGRRLTVTPIDDAVLHGGAVEAVDAAIRMPWHGEAFLFLVCVGGGMHAPTDLTALRPALAGVC